ncbi:MAG TPA: hypothetical protein VN682_21775 [Terriglobales bacterium]|jgi:hypothetical protein|nr:hypothetical protein [Terriglobales bacterium]
MELKLSAQEQQLLEAILEARYRVLQKEIAHTDHREFKQTLREHEKLIESILTRLRTATMAKAS